MNEPLQPKRHLAGSESHDPDEFVSLPAWLYRDEEFFAYEAERIFRPSWQIVCHISDIPTAGDFHSFEFLGESIFVVRGDDTVVRAFHNVCRHRASRLVEGPAGRCS